VLTTGLADGEIEDGVVAESEAQRSALWLLRERIPEAERRAGGSVKHDISVRLARIPAFIASASAALDAIAAHRLSVFGHVGDGNLHFNVLSAAGDDPAGFEAGAAEALSECVHTRAIELGGSFSAEHGVGVLKIAELERFKSPQALAAMRALKRALDPRGTMNPGKVLRDR
jgi:FAD/FMN-containing dehydrogenase